MSDEKHWPKYSISSINLSGIADYSTLLECNGSGIKSHDVLIPKVISLYLMQPLKLKIIHRAFVDSRAGFSQIEIRR